MLKDGTVIKVGIYRSGSHVRYVGECDLISQDNGNETEAIFLMEFCLVKDPREAFTEAEVEKSIEHVKRNFRERNTSFKAKDRNEADIFLKSKINEKWEVIREFTEV